MIAFGEVPLNFLITTFDNEHLNFKNKYFTMYKNQRFQQLCKNTLIIAVTVGLHIFVLTKIDPSINNFFSYNKKQEIRYDIQNVMVDKYTNYLLQDQEALKNFGVPSKYLNTSVYFINKNNNTTPPNYNAVKKEIKLTLDFFESNTLTRNVFNNVFEFDEQKVFSFIYFHEFAHTINIKQLDIKNDNNTEITNLLHKQYLEAFADIFAIYMMKKRYSDIDLEKTKTLLAGLRIFWDLKNNDAVHNSAIALLSENIVNDINYEQLVALSLKAAKINNDYYEKVMHSIHCNCTMGNKKIDNFVQNILIAKSNYLKEIKFHKKDNNL